MRELAGDALARLLAHQARAQDAEPAIHTALKLLALDPLQEPVYRTLMCLYLRQGRRAAALRQYQICVWTLRKELGAEPEPETRALYREALLQLGRKVGTATHLSVGHRGFVRRPADVEAPLVCRDAEMTALGDALIEAWSGAGRVVLIVGEAGIGKTPSRPGVPRAGAAPQPASPLDRRRAEHCGQPHWAAPDLVRLRDEPAE